MKPSSTPAISASAGPIIGRMVAQRYVQIRLIGRCAMGEDRQLGELGSFATSFLGTFANAPEAYQTKAAGRRPTPGEILPCAPKDAQLARQAL
jgi:hypothetical protein